MPNLSIEEYAKAQADEYGSYVATGPIYHDGALAYTEGHPVPKSNVEKFKYDEQKLVKKVAKADAETVQPAEVVAANVARKG